MSAKNERKFALALISFWMRSRSRSWNWKMVALSIALVNHDRALRAPLKWAALTKALPIITTLNYNCNSNYSILSFIIETLKIVLSLLFNCFSLAWPLLLRRCPKASVIRLTFFYDPIMKTTADYRGKCENGLLYLVIERKQYPCCRPINSA